MDNKKLYRIKPGVIGGVAAGLARYFDVDVWLVRLLFLVLMLIQPPAAFITYLVLWIILPSQENIQAQESTVYNAEPEPVDTGNDSNIFLGIFLITLGIIFLIDKFFLWISWKKLWPVLLILIGLYIIFDQLRNRENKEEEDDIIIEEVQPEMDPKKENSEETPKNSNQ